MVHALDSTGFAISAQTSPHPDQQSRLYKPAKPAKPDFDMSKQICLVTSFRNGVPDIARGRDRQTRAASQALCSGVGLSQSKLQKDRPQQPL